MNNETIRLMTYEDWEKEHKHIQKKVHQQQKKYREQMRRYYLNQKLFGTMIVLFGIIVAVAGEWIAVSELYGIGTFCTLGGLYIMVTQKHVLI